MDEIPDHGGESGPRTFPWRLLVMAAALAALILGGRALGLGGRLGELRGWISSLGGWGMVVFVLLYALGTVAALPGSAMTVAAGALWGSLAGVILVNVGATLGAGLAFLAGRYFARAAVVRWLGASERFRRLDRLTEEHGAVIVIITRLVPLFPFNLLNYGFGLTRVPFGTYLLWTWLGIIPGDVLYVVGTDAAVRAAAGGRVPWVLVGVLAATAAVLAVLVRLARTRLTRRGGG